MEPPTVTPASVVAAGASASNRFGPFVRVSLLGRGGFGEVWKAWDSKLRRWVALKLLMAGDDGEIERFQREAQTAAGLEHPNIAAVYDVGEECGRRYIAMELIDGEALGRRPLDGMEAARILRDAARAVQFAHDHGVIHRDLKPANLMLGRDGRVRVMDFGLARQLQGGSSLTASGMMVGTPTYMSPEQVRGEIHALDARTDVYGLGATLYECLAGRTPFAGGDLLQLLAHVLEEQPASIASIPPELDAIVLKCLEKEPARRYATAGEVADDLDRFLAGETVRARAAGPVRRVAVALRKRRVVVATVCVAAVAVAGVVVLGWRLLGSTEGQAEAARRGLVGPMRATAEACLSSMLGLRRADSLDAMETHARKAEEACRHVMALDATLAEPHYFIGRIRRAQMRNAEALEEQNRALEKEAGFAPARYERVILVSRLLRARLTELDRTARSEEGERLRQEGGGEVRPGGASRVEDPRSRVAGDAAAAALMERIEQDLRHLEGGVIGAGERECAEGLREWMRDAIDAARARLQRAVASTPDLEEGYEALAQMETERGDYEAAVRWLNAGAERDRGYVPFLEARGDAKSSLGHLKWLGGADARGALEEALVDFDEAVKRRPDRVAAWMGRAELRLTMGRAASSRGEDAGPLYRMAMSDFSEALKRGAPAGEALVGRGLALLNFASTRARRGEKAEEHYRAAIDDLTRASVADPESEEPWRSLGLAVGGLGKCREDHGVDPMADYLEAIRHFGAALQRNPTSDRSWLYRARVHSDLGKLRAARWADASESLRDALKDFDEATKRAPSRAETWIERGGLLSYLGSRAAERREPFEPTFEAAVASANRGLALAPGSGAPWKGRGGARVDWAKARMAAGQDPTVLLDAAIEDFDQSLQRNGADAGTWDWRGNACNTRGMWLEKRGDGKPAYERALSDYGESLRRNPGRADVWCARGGTHINLAGAMMKVSHDPEPELKAALADLDAALKLNPELVQARTWRARANGRWASWIESRRQEPAAKYEEAITDYEKALRPESRDAEAWRHLGALRCNLGIRRQAHREDPSALYAGAVEALDRAIALTPRDAAAREYRGNSNFTWGAWLGKQQKPGATRVKAALADYEEAARLDPASATRLEKSAERCRQWLKENP